MKKHDLNAVGDSAHDLAQDLKEDLAHLGADARRLATDYIAPRTRDLADYVTPIIREAATNVADYVQPRAKDLSERGVQFACDARETLQPTIEKLAADVPPRVARLASETLDTLQPYLDESRERLQPRLEDARERLQPLIDESRERLSHDVMPRLTDAYESVAELPQTKEAKKRLRAARAALAGDLALPEPAAKRSLGKTLLQLVLAGGLLAGVVYALRRLLAPEDSGWQPHEPSPAYVNRPAGSTAEPQDAPAEAAAEGEAQEPDEALPAGADPFVVSPYGEGSYVGDEPPEGYLIKGNERSMKFHVQGSGGYDRTIADVWFNSEEAAEAAGFTKAQR